MANDKHIFLLFADETLQHLLMDQLAEKHFSVHNGKELLDTDKEASNSVVLLDDGLPAIEEVCQRLSSRLPVAVLIRNERLLPTLRKAGASACILKPVRLAILADRLRVLLRETPSCWQIGPIEINPSARSAIGPDGQIIHLTEKEIDILVYLHRAGNRRVSREELLSDVWGYASEASTHTVETHIYRLRRKLNNNTLLTGPDGYSLAL